MRSSKLKSFKWKLTFKIVVTTLIALFFAWLIFVILIDGVLNDAIADTAYGIAPTVYRFIRANKEIFITGAVLVIVVGAVYYSISKVTMYIDEIIKSISNIAQKDDDFIKLPDDFKEVEDELNVIKYTAIKNEQIAKEAEQRKNDLIVYIAHDLKTPLTSVIGYLTLLNDEEKISDELRKKYLEISLDKAERLEELINEFFEITRFNLQSLELNKEETNLTMLLEQLTDEFFPVLKEKNLQCTLSADKDLYINADSDKIARVFDNLLKNAINYSFEDTEISINVIQDIDNTYIKVRNKGKKIPEQKLDKIFEKFYRLDSARTSKTGGAGLGLAIAKEIVEAHGGEISANSTDEYTEFTVRLVN